MFSYVGFFFLFVAGFLHDFKRVNCWSCHFFISWFTSYLGSKSSHNVCRKFLKIFCSPPVALLPFYQPGADGAFHSWEKLGVTAAFLCAESQHNLGYSSSFWLLFCAFHFCAKMAVTTLKSKYMNRELRGPHYHQANMCTHTHCGTDPVAGSDVQNYLVCKLLSPLLFHWLYWGVSIIWSN